MPCHCSAALGLRILWGCASAPHWLCWAQPHSALSNTTSHSHGLEGQEGTDGGGRGWRLQGWCFLPTGGREAKWQNFRGVLTLSFPLSSTRADRFYPLAIDFTLWKSLYFVDLVWTCWWRKEAFHVFLIRKLHNEEILLHLPASFNLDQFVTWNNNICCTPESYRKFWKTWDFEFLINVKNRVWIFLSYIYPQSYQLP